MGDAAHVVAGAEALRCRYRLLLWSGPDGKGRWFVFFDENMRDASGGRQGAAACEMLRICFPAGRVRTAGGKVPLPVRCCASASLRGGEKTKDRRIRRC